MKRVASLAISVAIVMSALPAIANAAEPAYNDINGHWAEQAIERWSDYGIIQGYNGLFYPSKDLTRAEMATILANLLGLEDSTPNAYLDLDGDAWYADAILKCTAAGIMEGDGSHCRPLDAISRQEGITMIARALGIAPIETQVLSQFIDSADVADWASGYVAAMVSDGVVGGTTDHKILPRSNIDRASTVAIIDRAVPAYGNIVGDIDLDAEYGTVLVTASGVSMSGSARNVLVAGGANGGKVVLAGADIAGALTVAAPNVTIVLKNGASANKVVFTSRATGSKVIVESGHVDLITLEEGADKSVIRVNSGASIDRIESAADDVSVSGGGKVGTVVAGGDRTKVDVVGAKVEAAFGASGTMAGDRRVNGGQSAVVRPSTPSGESGGSSSEQEPHVHQYVYSDNGDGTHTGICSCGQNTGYADHQYGEDGACIQCGAMQKEWVASVTENEDVTYYWSLYSAFREADEPGAMVTLLQDVSKHFFWRVEEDRDIVFNMNGKYMLDANIWVEGGKLELVGNGTVACVDDRSFPVMMRGGELALAGVTIESPGRVALMLQNEPGIHEGHTTSRIIVRDGTTNSINSHGEGGAAIAATSVERPIVWSICGEGLGTGRLKANGDEHAISHDSGFAPIYGEIRHCDVVMSSQGDNIRQGKTSWLLFDDIVGHFSSDVTQYCAANHYAKQTDDGYVYASLDSGDAACCITDEDGKTTYSASLEQAISLARDNSTVTILQNVSCDGEIKNVLANNLVFDLNKNTICAAGGWEVGTITPDGVPSPLYATIKNGTYLVEDKSAGSITCKNAGEITFEKVAFHYTGDQVGCVIDANATMTKEDYGKFIFRDCSFKNSGVSFRGYAHSENLYDLRFDQCDFSGNIGSGIGFINMEVSAYGDICLSDCTFTGTQVDAGPAMVQVGAIWGVDPSRKTTVYLEGANRFVGTTTKSEFGEYVPRPFSHINHEHTFDFVESGVGTSYTINGIPTNSTSAVSVIVKDEESVVATWKEEIYSKDIYRELECNPPRRVKAMLINGTIVNPETYTSWIYDGYIHIKFLEHGIVGDTTIELGPIQ